MAAGLTHSACTPFLPKHKGEGGSYRRRVPARVLQESEEADLVLSSAGSSDHAADDTDVAWSLKGEHLMDVIRSWAPQLLAGGPDAHDSRRIGMEATLHWIQRTLDMLRPGHFKLTQNRSRGAVRVAYQSVALLRSWMLSGMLQHSGSLKAR